MGIKALYGLASLADSVDSMAFGKIKTEGGTNVEKYEIYTNYVVGSTSRKYNVGDVIPSMGFGTPDYRIWKVDHENKRYYVEELD